MGTRTNNYFKLIVVSALGLRTETFFFFNVRSLTSKSNARYNLIQATEEFKKQGAVTTQQSIFRRLHGTPIAEVGE